MRNDRVRKFIFLGMFGKFSEVEIIIYGRRVIVLLDIGYIVLIISKLFYVRELL